MNGVEAARALLNGEKVRAIHWPVGMYLVMNEQRSLVNHEGKNFFEMYGRLYGQHTVGLDLLVKEESSVYEIYVPVASDVELVAEMRRLASLGPDHPYCNAYSACADMLEKRSLKP